jgi:hypothetical protein
LSNDCKNYNSGFQSSYQAWIGKYTNCTFDYFARHNDGVPVKYQFNSLGYRGHEHCANPDISVFGSSFSFGVGIEFDQCWHQQLGNYRVNCYSPAGFLVTNNDIIDHYNHTDISTGIVILQLREFRYNINDINIPENVLCFVVDECPQPGLLSLPWSSFVDKAHDQTHPGPKTHKLWAQIIKKKFNL